MALATLMAALAGCQPPTGTAGAGGEGGRAVSSKLPGAGRTGTLPTKTSAGGAEPEKPKPGQGGATGTGGTGAGGTGTGGGTAGTGGTGGQTGTGGTGTGGPATGTFGSATPGVIPTRTIPAEASVASLIGKAKLLSDSGSSIISNAGAGIIANNGSGIIANNGSGVIANNGGGLLSDSGTSYKLLAAPAEKPLADATVEVFDAAGNRLLGADGKGITARTDAQGNYRLDAKLPNENLVLRIRLADGVAKDGELRAFLTKDQPRTGASVDVDTASTLGATYVLAKYVKGRQDVFERLPGTEDAALRRDMEAARERLTARPTYRDADLVAAVDGLRGQDTTLDGTLVRIEKLLTIGQANLGAGLPATTVALAGPVAIAPDGAGGFFVGETPLGRVRQVDAQGVMRTYVAPDGGVVTGNFGSVDDMALGPDGRLYAVEPKSRRIRRIGLANTFEEVAGNAEVPVHPERSAADGKPATQAALQPACMAFGPDGTLFLGEAETVQNFSVGTPGRLFERRRDGTLRQIPNDGAIWRDRQARGMAVGADGTLWVAAHLRTGGTENTSGAVLRLRPGAAWEVVKDGMEFGGQPAIVAAPDGGVWACEDRGHRVSKVAANGAKTVVAGTGAAGFAGDGGPATAAQLNQPTSLFRATDGTLYVADFGNGLVRAIAPDGKIRTVAGTTAATQQGDASRISINGPAGVTFNPAGELVISELGGNAVKRFDGTNLVLVAGTERGFAGDGGPATAARLVEPTGLAYDAAGNLFIGDHGNHRIRKVAPNGTITTVAGLGKDTEPKITGSPFTAQSNTGATAALAMSPDGLLHWTVMTHHRVLRLNAQGQVEVVAGALSTAGGNPAPGDVGDGGPATQAKFSSPMGLAFNPAGDMFIADAVNGRVRKVDKAGQVSTVAGVAPGEALAVLMGGTLTPVEGQAATSAVLAIPSALAFGPDGALYIGEAGTKNIGSIGIFPALPLVLPATIPARVRKLTPDGKLFTVAGPGGKVLNGLDGQEPLGLPLGLAFDKQGRLIIVDTANNQVKIVPAGQF